MLLMTGIISNKILKGNKMKCIIRQYGFGGGAPRSILQHIKVLKQLSYDHIVCMSGNTDDQLKADFEEEVNQLIIRTCPAELCWAKKYVSAFREYLWEYRYIKNNSPDLVIVLGQLNGALYSDICKKLGIPLIVYIAGGTIDEHDPCFDFWHNCEVICFSLENADMITKHFSAAHTNVISNRISVHDRFEDVEEHYLSLNPIVNVLIVSRLDQQKIQSIFSALNVLAKCSGNDLQINVRIAGRGVCQEELNTFCESLQSDCLKIQMLGQVHDLTEHFRWAHVIAGKGRSVIEPIMMNRIGCIIGDDGKIEFCSKDSFENLYHYNFSGRELRNADACSEMNEMLIKIRNGHISKDFVMDNAEMTIQRYAAEFLPQKLEQVLAKLPPKFQSDKKVHHIINYIRLVAKYMFFDLFHKRV